MRRLAAKLVLLAPLLLGNVCEGEGDERPGSITQGPIEARCSPIGGLFPSGFDIVEGSETEAVAVSFLPAGLLRFDLSSLPPRPDNAAPVPALPDDSDGDGLADAQGFRMAGLCPPANPDCRTEPKLGGVNAAFPELALVTSSTYEQVLFYEPDTGALRELDVESPSASQADPADRPLYPPAGTSPPRTAVSTLVCVYPPIAIDSNGDPFGATAPCDPLRPGYLSNFTAATAVAGGRLFVATSNLASSSTAAFRPGSVLVFEIETDAGGDPIRVAPDLATPVVFTTAYNPTWLTAHRTPGGRDVVLVTMTGSISTAGDLLSDSAVEVIDVNSPRVVARIPLGRAGASSGDIAIDPAGRFGLLGVESNRHLLGIDLSVLDDPRLYEPRTEPVVLDGSDPGFPDAVIFDADDPFELGRRADGPPNVLCTPRTNVALNHDGTLAYATDWCDGTIVIVSVDSTPPLEQPPAPTRFEVVDRLEIATPKFPANFGLPAAPSLPRTRPGVPGVDFDGPDLFYIINEPEGQLCAARVEF